jgi:monoamine oxidase
METSHMPPKNTPAEQKVAGSRPRKWNENCASGIVRKRQPDAIVIGAGAAGLAAARRLAEAGARVDLLEARERIGGRIHTRRREGWPVPIELGAEFVHGRPPETFRIVREAGLLMDRLPDSHALVARGGVRESGEFFDRMMRVTSRMKSSGPDRSVADFLAGQKKLGSDLRGYFRSFVEGYHAAPLEKASERALSTAGEGPPEPGENDQFRIVSGYDRLAEWLLAKAGEEVTLRLSRVVERIEWKRGKVSVEVRRASGGSPERVEAKKAIVAVPLAALKAPRGAPGAVRFDPEIPEKSRAVSKLQTGDAAKVVFLFRERFWEEEGLLAGCENRFDFNFFHSRRPPFPTWWTAAPAEVPMLTGWTGGPSAEKLLAESDATIARVALESLGRLLGIPLRRLRSLLEEWHTHNWRTDPFSRGAYSFTGVGGVSAHRALSRPVAGTLFFAGEATDRDQSGTVAGAVASGDRAARELLGRG